MEGRYLETKKKIKAMIFFFFYCYTVPYWMRGKPAMCVNRGKQLILESS